MAGPSTQGQAMPQSGHTSPGLIKQDRGLWWRSTQVQTYQAGSLKGDVRVIGHGNGIRYT